MFKRPLGFLGIFLIVVGFGYFIGAGVAYSKTQAGYGSLEAFSNAQSVELSYDDEGRLIDRGTVEGAQAIRSLLENDWNFPAVDGKGGLDPNDPVVDNQSEYMFQMATIVYHTLNGEQTVVLTPEKIAAAIEAGGLGADGTYDGVVEAYRGQVLEAGVPYTVPVNGRYWTGFDRMDILDGAARELAWSGTAHALVAELGVGAATHSALMLALGIAGLLAGLGVVCTVMGVAFLWHTRQTMAAGGANQVAVPDTVPREFVDEAGRQLENV